MNKKIFKIVIISSLLLCFSTIDVNAETICKRATTLHTENCTKDFTDSYCSGSGYTENGSKKTTTVTYGNLGTIGTLVSGDAFDCDVNGDGDYDEITERFYYVTDMNEDTAVLIYYNDVSGGLPNNSVIYPYDENGDAYTNGPGTAIKQLPTISQWSNVSLTNTTRDIIDNTGTVRKTGFSYAGYAARLLTTQELEKACNITVGNKTEGELDSCIYLMENTNYANDDAYNTYGYWLETVDTPVVIQDSTMFNYKYAWTVNGYTRKIDTMDVEYYSIFGVRPVIEVKKNNIEIGNDEPLIEDKKESNDEIVYVEDTAFNLNKYLIISGILVTGIGILIIMYIIKQKKINKK